MQAYFYSVADQITQLLNSNEHYLCSFYGEQSDFIRFNHAQIRQVSHVDQLHIQLTLIEQQRQAKGTVSLTGDTTIDKKRIEQLLNELRLQFAHLPEDPFLHIATQVQCSHIDNRNTLPRPTHIVKTILNTVKGTDFVGLYAAGGMFHGFANSFGQRNWHGNYSFNLDWSFYHDKDKAVKCAYAGFSWDDQIFANKVTRALGELKILQRPAKTISPGRYRVYLSPTALYELLQLVSSDFSLKKQRTKQSTLLQMIESPKRQLHTNLTLRENNRMGLVPTFQEQGFLKPEEIVLISKGKYYSSLISPRSAKEYGELHNSAHEDEIPLSLELEAGTLTEDEILSTLGTGIYINNLWYTNFSDRSACRITGMTRFATFWVEQGEIVAPLNVMRFDETLYRLLGDNLLALTAQRELLIDSSTYEKRSTSSALLPGALIEELTLTL